jgi:hypothetical protein
MRILSDGDEIDVNTLNNIELFRLLVLMRDWDVDEELTQENVLRFKIPVFKAFLDGISQEIGVSGLF